MVYCASPSRDELHMVLLGEVMALYDITIKSRYSLLKQNECIASTHTLANRYVTLLYSFLHGTVKTRLMSLITHF